MIEQQAKVIRVAGDRITVESLQTSACEHCAQKSSCGSSLYAKLLPRRQMQLKLTSAIALHEGDTVVIGISEAGLLRASLLLYLVPLIIMLIVVSVYDSSAADPNETIAAVLALASLGGSLYLIHRIQTYFMYFFMTAPTIIRKD